MNGIVLPVAENGEVIRTLYREVIDKTHNRNTFNVENEIGNYSISSKASCLKAFNNFFAAIDKAFPDYQLNIDSLSTNGDRVMVRYTIQGTHEKEFMGIAPNRGKMTIKGIDIFRLDNGVIIEHWDAAHQGSYR